MGEERKVLVIEDNRNDIELLMHQLKKADFDKHVRVIEDGKKALEYFTDETLKNENLVAIFLDMHLPRVNGLEILATIRASKHHHAIPVIVVTSSQDPNILEKCQKLGVSAFIPKPIILSSFVKAFADTFQTTVDE